MISSFFKTRKPKQFNFSARYYDESREELKERYERIKGEVHGGSSKSGPRVVDFKSKWVQKKNTSHFESKSNIRLLVIFGLLCAICYFLLFY